MDPHRLREETRVHHEATEALFPLTRPNLTREEYVHTLETLFPVIASWEDWSTREAPADVRGILSSRRRSALLLKDLEMLGGLVKQDAITAVNWSRVFDRKGCEPGTEEYKATFLGALYVVEGSTLGGRLIARHVESVLHLEPGKGSAYFQGYKDATGSMWREVTALIAAVPDDLAPALIAAAKNTFDIFGGAFGTEKSFIEEPKLTPLL